jgi:hypothetical protein
MAQDRGRRPEAHDHGDAAGPEREPHDPRKRDDVERPGPLQEAEPGVAQDVGRQPAERAVVRRLEAAMQVPYEVAQEPVVVGEVRGAIRPVLPVVALRVEAGPGARSAQAAPDEEKGEETAEPAARLVGPVDDPPVQADRMARAEREDGEAERRRERPCVQGGQAPDETGQEQAPEPGHPEGIEADPADVRRNY